MPRLALVALLILAAAGCDTGGPEVDARFLGTWDRTVVVQMTVVSEVAQRYDGLDVQADGAITVSGAMSATLRSFVGEPGTQTRVEDRLFTVLSVLPDRGILTRTVDGASEQVELPGLAATTGTSPATLTVPETTVQTSAGSVTIGGTVTARAVDLPAGTAVALPADVDVQRYSRRLRITEAGAEILSVNLADPAAAPNVIDTATWAAEGDAITLTFASDASSRTETYELTNGALVRFEDPTDFPTRSAEEQKRLEPGSLTSASQRVQYRFTRID